MDNRAYPGCWVKQFFLECCLFRGNIDRRSSTATLCCNQRAASHEKIVNLSTCVQCLGSGRCCPPDFVSQLALVGTKNLFQNHIKNYQRRGCTPQIVKETGVLI